MKLGVFQSKNSSIVYDAEQNKIITSSQVFQRSAVAEAYNSKTSKSGRSRTSYSFAKIVGAPNSGKSSSLSKHKKKAPSRAKRADSSQEQFEHTEDLSQYASNTSADHIKMLPAPIEPTHLQPAPYLDDNRTVFHPITNTGSRFLTLVDQKTDLAASLTVNKPT